jgi:hypothetical protein
VVLVVRNLRYNTAVQVTVGPFRDKTDGVTIKNSLTISNERITLTADTDDGNAPTIILDNVVGATSGTDNDLNYISNCDAGLMRLKLSAANTQRYGRMFLTIDDPNNHVSVFHEFEILSQEFYDAKYGSGNLPANTKAISGDAGAADNLEAACDGSGYNLGCGQIVAASVTSKSEYTLTSAYDAAKSAASQSSVNAIGAILDDLHDTDIPAIKTVVDANGVKLVAIQGKTDMLPIVWFSP